MQATCPKCYRIQKGYPERCECGYNLVTNKTDCEMCGSSRTATQKVCRCGYVFATREFIEGSVGHEKVDAGFFGAFRRLKRINPVGFFVLMILVYLVIRVVGRALT